MSNYSRKVKILGKSRVSNIGASIEDLEKIIKEGSKIRKEHKDLPMKKEVRDLVKAFLDEWDSDYSNVGDKPTLRDFYYWLNE